MKITELKNIVKTAVREAIQEELKEILLEAIKSPKQVVQESTPAVVAQPSSLPTKSKKELRESYKNILGETAASFNTSQIGQPLQMTNLDTTSPNGSLPQGEVGMNQIVDFMNGKA